MCPFSVISYGILIWRKKYIQITHYFFIVCWRPAKISIWYDDDLQIFLYSILKTIFLYNMLEICQYFYIVFRTPANIYLYSILNTTNITRHFRGHQQIFLDKILKTSQYFYMVNWKQANILIKWNWDQTILLFSILNTIQYF